MMNYSSEIGAENGQALLILFIFFNSGFFPLIDLIKIPELASILFVSIIYPILLYLGRRWLSIIK